MDVRELELGLRGNLGDKAQYTGIYTSDNIPYIQETPQPIVFIVNTLKSTADTRILGHWVSFYLEYPRLIFFDSYGFHPYLYGESFKRIIDLYKTKGMECIYFNKQLQPNTSVKCGLYTLFFIHYTSHYTIDAFIDTYFNIFSSSLEENDRIVTHYYFKYMNAGRSCKDWKYGKDRAIRYQECLCLSK